MTTGTLMGMHGQFQTLLDRGTLGGEPDARLLEVFLDGDSATAEAAFAAIVARHAAMVRRVCFGVLDHAEDAEDASQAVFLILARRARSVRRRGSAASWLHGTARHVALRTRRELDRRRHRERRWAETAGRGIETPDDPLATLAREDLHRELDRLPEFDRTPIILCHLDGLSHAEAAARLGCPLRTFQSRLLRARNRLRDRLRRAGLEPAAVSIPAFPSGWPEKVAESALAFATNRGMTTTAAAIAARFLAGRFASRITLAATTLLFAMLVAGATAMTKGPAPVERRDDESAPASQSTPPDESANRTIEIRVVERKGGMPIEGAEVEVIVSGAWHPSADDTEVMARRTTDSRGLCRIDFPRQLKRFRIDVRKAGYASRSYYHPVHSPRSGLPQQRTMELERGISIGGVVTDRRNRPIPKAAVNVWLSVRQERPPESTHIEARSITDDLGRWRLDDMPPTWTSLGLHASHPDFVPSLRQPKPTFTRPTDDQLRAGKASIVLDEGIVATGRVLDVAGRPIPGTSVLAGDYRPSGDSGLGPATADAEGRFRIHLPAGIETFTAQARGREPASTRVLVEPGMKPIELNLGAGRRIAGRVVDTHGRPLEGVAVEVSQWKGLTVLDWSGKTDAEGRFAWDSAPAEPVFLAFSLPGFTPVGHRPFQAGGPTPDIVMHPPLRVSGTVVDAKTGRPIPRFTISDGHYRSDLEPETRRPDWSSEEPRREFAEGTYEIQYDHPYLNAVALRIEAEGHQPATSGRISMADGEVVFDAKLEPGVDPSGVVLGLDSRPLAGATVVLWDRSSRGKWYSPLSSYILDSDVVTKTDGEGRFHFTPQAESFRVFVEHASGFAEANGRDFEPGRPPLTLALRPWARVEGTVKIGSKPAKGVTVELSDSGIRTWGPEEATRLLQSERRETDAEGRYTFERVLPGRFTVARTFPLARRPHASGRAPSQGILIEAGKTLRVDLEGEGRPVVGRFRIPTGIDPTAVFSIQGQELVRVPSQEGGPIQTAISFDTNVRPDGSFLVEDVPPGRYRLRAEVHAPGITRNSVEGPKLAEADVQVIVPGASGGPPEKPLEVGEIMLKPVPTVAH